MTKESLSEELEKMISAGLSLRQIVSNLRGYRRAGITRDEVRLSLESLRNRVPDEATEDRILEVMDIVTGFCPQETTVWDD
jgi:hypothetical protein